MCVVSNITGPGGWPDTAKERYPWITEPYMPQGPDKTSLEGLLPPSKEEFDALKAEVEALKELLKHAKKFDEQTGQPNCQKEEEGIELIKRLAEVLGVDLENII